MFSATLPQAIIQFSRAGLKDPEMVRLDVDTKVSENLKVWCGSQLACQIPLSLSRIGRDEPDWHPDVDCNDNDDDDGGGGGIDSLVS